MTNRTAATRYARALLDVALTERADVNVIDAQLAAIADLFNQHEALRKVLLTPAVPVPNKRALIVELLDKMAVLPLVKKTLLLLVENDRLALIPDVAEAFRQRLLDMRNVVRADVTTADALPPERLAAIQGSLAAATGRTVELTSRVDPSIVGGMVARIGSTVYDASIVNHLKRIRQRLDASI
ncbi:MAG: ATP synthase F1 subunit delta [Vicinamibacterales bacterium]